MQYSIRHITKFAYDLPITESVMETRMQPRTDARQRCVHFGLTTTPASRVLMYQDHDGNIVHHFGIPGRHARLTVTAQAIVECEAAPDLPRSLGPESWRDLGEAADAGVATRPVELGDGDELRRGVIRRQDGTAAIGEAIAWLVGTATADTIGPSDRDQRSELLQIIRQCRSDVTAARTAFG